MKEVLSIVAQELVEALTKIFDDREFVEGMLAYASTESDRKVLLDFIRAGEDVDLETVTVLAIHLSNSNDSRLRRFWRKFIP